MRADFALDYDVLTVERPQKVYLMARFVAGPGPNDQVRKPLNLSLVIDRSGSMAGAKIDYTRQAAQFLVQHLTPRDTFSIVLYDDKVETLLGPERVVNKDSIIQRLEQVRARGTTNLSGGWLQGVQHVLAQRDSLSLNRVLLMTDGLANRGISDTPSLTQMARQKFEEGVSTTTMGLGEDFNEDLLMAMAEAGGGAFYFIESPEVTPTIFQEELSGLLSLVGQNLKISILPSPDVAQVRQLNNYPMESSAQSVTFRLGDVYGDEVKTLVLELSIPALSSLGPKAIATLHFEYDELLPSGTRHEVHETTVMVNVASLAQPTLPDQEVTQAVLLLRAANARQEAVKAADRGQFDQASLALREVAQAIEQAGLDDDHLDEERRALLEQADRMKQGAEAYNDYERKTMSTQAYYTSTGKHDATVMLRQRESSRRSEGKPDTQAIPTDLYTIHQGTTPTHVNWRDKTFLLVGEVIRIGRGRQNEIVIDEKGISRYHAQLRREGDALYIEDLQSTNGTHVNQRRIDQPHRLSAGEVVVIGEEKLIFHLGNLTPQA